jgi:hypothetical protein
MIRIRFRDTIDDNLSAKGPKPIPYDPWGYRNLSFADPKNWPSRMWITILFPIGNFLKCFRSPESSTFSLLGLFKIFCELTMTMVENNKEQIKLFYFTYRLPLHFPSSISSLLILRRIRHFPSSPMAF